MYLNTGMDFFARGGGAGYPVFYDIPDAEQVYQLALRTRQGLV
jgi:hypothetical protein